MAVKFHEKNQAVYFGLQANTGSAFKLETGTGAIASVTATVGASPVFSCTADNLYVGQAVTLSGTNSGALITGYVTGAVYYIIGISTTSVAGVTGFTLSATKGGATVVTTGTGGSTGLTFATNSLTSTEAIACTEISSDVTRDTGSFQYLGDALSRDEFTYTKDIYIDLGITTFQQVLSDMGSAIDPNTSSIWKLFQVCGGNVVVDATSKEVYVDNATDSADYGTADVRFASPDDPTNDKLYKFWDLRGSVDVNASLGEVPTLKFSLKGNADDPVAKAKQAANFGFQTTRVSPSVLYSTVKVAQLLDLSATESYTATGLTGNTSLTLAYAGAQVTATLTAHDLPVGSIRRIRIASASVATFNGDWVAYAISATKVIFYVKGNTGTGTATGATLTKGQNVAPETFCFSTLSAGNYFGFDYQRYLTGCDQGFAKGATPSDVAVTMLEDQVGGSSFNPDANVSKFYAAVLKFGGSTAGSTVAYMWDKLQLATVKQGKVATYMGRDVTFRNTGSSFIFYQ